LNLSCSWRQSCAHGLVSANAQPHFITFEKVGTSGQYFVDWYALSAFELALPNIKNPPTLIDQLRSYCLIPADVAGDLGPPKFFAGRRPAKQCTVVTMPEAAMDEDDGAPRWEHKVRLAR